MKPPSGKKRHVRDALLGERIDETVIGAACQIVEVLNANDLRDFLSFLELSGSDVAETDVPNESLTLQFGKRREWFLNGAFRGLQSCAYPEIDDVEVINTQIPKIVMNTVDQVLARKSWNPRLVSTTIERPTS